MLIILLFAMVILIVMFSAAAERRPTMLQSYYRTKDGLADYKFSFERQSDGNYRAYILELPDYRWRSSSPTTTHRLRDNDRNYICWSQPLWSEAEARTVAALWADLTQEYIKTGRTIDEQVRRRR